MELNYNQPNSIIVKKQVNDEETEIIVTSNCGLHQFIVLPWLWDHLYQAAGCLVHLYGLPNFTHYLCKDPSAEEGRA